MTHDRTQYCARATYEVTLQLMTVGNSSMDLSALDFAKIRRHKIYDYEFYGFGKPR